MFFKLMLATVLSSLSLVSGVHHAKDEKRETRYPKLIHAEMPLYPALARTAHISGTVEIQITVERGSVVEAQVKSSSSPHLTKPTIANIKTWQFESGDPTTFLVTFVFEIKGKQTRVPENPRLEINLPKFVRIIAKPFKPTRT